MDQITFAAATTCHQFRETAGCYAVGVAGIVAVEIYHES